MLHLPPFKTFLLQLHFIYIHFLFLLLSLRFPFFLSSFLTLFSLFAIYAHVRKLLSAYIKFIFAASRQSWLPISMVFIAQSSYRKWRTSQLLVWEQQAYALCGTLQLVRISSGQLALNRVHRLVEPGSILQKYGLIKTAFLYIPVCIKIWGNYYVISIFFFFPTYSSPSFSLFLLLCITLLTTNIIFILFVQKSKKQTKNYNLINQLLIIYCLSS